MLYSSGVAIGCAGCIAHGPGAVRGPKFARRCFSSNVDCIRINLENHLLNYENRICSIRMQLAAS